jgi:hypothetical protein
LGIVIDEIHYHVRSNQAAENVGQRCKQGFDRRGDSLDIVRVDACDNVETDAAFPHTTDFAEHRVAGFTLRKCSLHESISSVIAEGASEILRHARTESLDRSADCVGLLCRRDLSRHQLPN